MVKCAACGHSWLEARAIEIPTVQPRNLPTTIEHGYEPDSEIRRLVEATREAEENFASLRKQRNRRVYGWLGFAASLTLPFVLAGLFPEATVSLAPVTAAAYTKVGKDVNIFGLDLRRIELQHMIVDGTRVLAVKGEIANITGTERKIPWLRFGLQNAAKGEVYSWTLDTGARPLRPGEVTNFVTRVATPPETAQNVEIRFARHEEIGSSAGL